MYLLSKQQFTKYCITIPKLCFDSFDSGKLFLFNYHLFTLKFYGFSFHLAKKNTNMHYRSLQPFKQKANTNEVFLIQQILFNAIYFPFVTFTAKSLFIINYCLILFNYFLSFTSYFLLFSFTHSATVLLFLNCH